MERLTASGPRQVKLTRLLIPWKRLSRPDSTPSTISAKGRRRAVTRFIQRRNSRLRSCLKDRDPENPLREAARLGLLAALQVNLFECGLPVFPAGEVEYPSGRNHRVAAN